MMLMGNYYSSLGMNFNVNNNNGGGGGRVLFSGNPSVITNMPGLKHDTGLAVEWTLEEQYKLDEGLINAVSFHLFSPSVHMYDSHSDFDDRFANEPSIMKYIKIAATLRDKTVRDVALRCRWMTRKRRKQDDYTLGKKVKDRKEKSAEVSAKAGTSSASPLSFIPYSLSSNHRDRGDVTPSAVGSMCITWNEASTGRKQSGSESNFGKPFSSQVGITFAVVPDKLTVSYLPLSRCKVYLRDYPMSGTTCYSSWLHVMPDIPERMPWITSAFYIMVRKGETSTSPVASINMRNMPGIMSQMPPLPVLLNEELASSVLPSTTQPMMFGSTSGIQLKQEPGC
ncbi:hypothetical protein RND71_002358 [Anisodus tanguticus]|uniref:Uncharacterized protein n=1 Tax=Anisodus tanguticus TaxID=243964 RepID=A0AAE1T3P5_9SOLA|nr:hypothetical protein RND71_002358 [Anisodus tanguticus]